MHHIEVSPNQKKALGITTALALIVGIYFLKPYFLLIAFTAIVAFTFNPIYKRLVAAGRRPGTAASLTFFCSLLAMIIPVALVIFVSVHQVINLANTVTHGSHNVNVNDLLKHAVDSINHVMASLHLSYRLSVSDVTNGLSKFLKNIGNSLLHDAGSSVSSVFSFFTMAIIYIYIFLSLLTKQDQLLSAVHALNPLGNQIGQLYIKRMAAMTRAMVRGQFIIAILQGLTDAGLLYIAGLHNTFFFFFFLLTLLSIIPLGGGIIAIPIGIVMVFTGNVWQGLLVIIGHLVIVTNIDNVLRPQLVPDEARLDPALTLLSVFAGLKFFGFLGIIIGPVLMILIVTTIQVFMEVYRDMDTIDNEGKRHVPKRRFRRIFKLRKRPVEISE
ncbi:MAG TPA: AI-2E family transporter [Candidatus Saccharimonadales bacterium]|nr:AI-2E family transporter [Candidatus Saccharimonadales bacterium]